MKSKCLLLALMAMLCLDVNAQNDPTNDDWSTTGTTTSITNGSAHILNTGLNINPEIRIFSDDGLGTSSFAIRDLTANQMRLEKYTAAGASLIDINPFALDGSSAATFRFFRLTNTSGPVFFEIFKGDGSATVQSRLSANGNSFFNLNTGNVGIGTSAPGSKLEVAGIITATGGTSTKWNAMEQNANSYADSVTALIQNTVDSEEAFRIAADSILQLLLESEVVLLMNEDSSLAAALQSEIARAQNAEAILSATDSLLQFLFESDVVLLTAEDSALAAALQTEIADRTAAEAALQAAIDSLINTPEVDPKVGSQDTCKIPKWNGSALVDGTMSDVGGKVGIGTTSAIDQLHLLDGGIGNRVRIENSGTGYAGIVAKNTFREMFVGVVGTEPGKFLIYDNTSFQYRLTIDTTGEVGINTNSPTQTLDVNGKVRIRDLALDNTKDSVLVACGDGTLAYRDISTIGEGQWQSSANDIYNDNSGKVGVGTSAPGAKLHVNYQSGFPNTLALYTSSISNDEFLSINDLKGSSGMGFGVNHFYDDSNSDSVPNLNHPSWKMGFYTLSNRVVFQYRNANDPESTFSDFFSIKGITGNVGIATTSPTQKLDVNGKVRIRDLALDNTKDSVLVACGDGTLAYRDISTIGEGQWLSSGNDIYNSTTGGVGIGDATPDGKLEVRQSGTADILNLYDGSSNVLTVRDGGNVGIGLTNPTDKLHVSGGDLLIGHHSISTALFTGLKLQYSTSGEGAIMSSFNDGWGYLTFYTKEASGQPITEKMRIEKDGRVGIGDATPDGQLEVRQTGTGDILNLYDNTTNVLTVQDGGNVGIGTTTPINKLDVEGGAVIGASYSGSSTAPANGLLVEGNVGIGTTSATFPLTMSPGNANYGIFTDHNKSTSGITYGLYIDLDNTYSSGATTYGARIDGYKSGGGGNVYGSYLAGRNYNSSGTSSSTYGAYGYAYRSSTTPVSTTYAVYGQPSGNAATEYGGYFVGNVYTTGSYLPSDAKIKSNVRDYQGALEKIAQLESKEYSYKTEEYKHFNFPEGQQIGLMAENLKQVFPHLVKASHQPEVLVPEEDAIDMNADYTITDDGMAKIADGLDFDVVNYTGLIPVLVQGIQEQQEEIEEVKGQVANAQNYDDEIAALQDAVKERDEVIEKMQRNMEIMMQQVAQIDLDLQQCCLQHQTGSAHGNGSSNGTSLDDEPHLAQNVPNPFSEKTIIRYYIPKSGKWKVEGGMIRVIDLKGTVLWRYDLVDSGYGQIEIDANTFAPATYIYELIVGDKKIDSKKMVIE